MKSLKMSIIKQFVLACFVGLAFSTSACNEVEKTGNLVEPTVESSEKGDHKCSEKCAETSTHDKAMSGVKTADVMFSKDKVYEIAYASILGGKESEIHNDYFPKILPIAAKYGAKMMAGFEVTAVTGGEMNPQMVAIFEWPNVEAREKLLADKEAQKLFPIRDAALSFIKLAYYKVDEDVTITFRADKTYEFFNAWLTPEAETALPKYFEASKAPKQNYGPPAFIASFKPIEDSPKDDYTLQPQMAGLVEWENTNAYYGLLADPAYKKAKPLLEKSVTRLDMIHTKFNFPH